MANKITNKMKKEGNKKSQVTMFFMLGFVMFVVVMFMLILVNITSEQRAQRQAVRSVQEHLDSASVNYYVRSCLELATTEAVNEVLLNGGILYESQRGPLAIGEPGKSHIPVILDFSHPDQQIHVKANVSYSIFQGNPCSVKDSAVPAYPKHRTRMEDLHPIYQQQFSCSLDRRNKLDYSGFFGFNNFTRLCYHGSHNFESSPGFLSPCRNNYLISSNNESVEKYLSKRVLDILDECIDFDYLAGIQEHDFSIDTSEEKEIKIILNRNSLSVSASYPFEISLQGRDSMFLRHEFNYASNLRLTKLYNFAWILLTAESKMHNFNPITDYNNPFFRNLFPGLETYYDSFFEVEIMEFMDCQDNECQEYKFDRVLLVKDTVSFIGGRPLTFATSIRNRNPALDYISDHYLDLSYDLFVVEGEELIIDPWGYDPDDREVTYRYSGWKQDYDKKCEIVSGVIECQVIDIDDDFVTLMDSEMFQETQRAVNYTTNESDIGLHEVTVYVYDKEGLHDFQTVRILVFKSPAAEIVMNPVYSGMPENISSIEDPAVFKGLIQDADAYQDYDVTITQANWRLRNHQGELIIQTSEDISGDINDEYDFTIPFQNYDILNIANLEIKNVGKYFLELFFILNLTIDNNEIVAQSIPFELELDIEQCLPVRNTHLIFPYSTYDAMGYGAGFGANHTCCLDTYERAQANYACHSEKWYGEFFKLRNDKSQELMKVNELQNYNNVGDLSFSGINFPQPNRINSVYGLDFKRYCDGERGNICAGSGDANLQMHEQCNFDSSLDEQCSGPNPNTNPSQSPMSCYDYTTNNPNNLITFENLFDVPGATGACLSEGACSTANSPTGYADGGIHWCTKAFCYQGDCTRTFLTQGCTCNRDDCGAECDSTYLSEWNQNTCKADCNSANCQFSLLQQTKCPNPTSNPQYFGSTHCYNAAERFCFHQVKCTSSGESHIHGQYCDKESGLFEVLINDLNNNQEVTTSACLYDQNNVANNRCTNTGNCRLQLTLFECLDQNFNPVCGANSARCEDASGNLGQIVYYNNYEIINYII